MAFVSRMRQVQFREKTERVPEGFVSRVHLMAAPLRIPPSLAQMVSELTLPIDTSAASPAPLTPAQQAIFLLQIAAEVEHAFLLQYLYAAYSITPAGPLSAAVSTIRQVAREEMGHLVTVQNLLMCLDQPLDLNREDFPKHPDLYPFPAALEPITSNALAKYVTAESPAWEDIPDAATRELAAKAAAQIESVTPSVHHVGVIYAALYWLLQTGDAAEGPWQLDQSVIEQFVAKFGSGFHVADADFASEEKIKRFGATKMEWGGASSVHVDAAFPRTSALAALATISQQGEGAAASPAVPSHFQVFLKMYTTFASIPTLAIQDVPTNPFVAVDAGGPPDTSPGAITNVETGMWATLLNVRYRMLLLNILIGLSLDNTTDGDLRGTVIGTWAVESEMMSFIAPVAKGLTGKLRGAAGDSPQFAAAPFTFGDALPDSACDRWKELASLIATSRRIRDQLSALPQISDDDKQLLADMADFEEGRAAVIQANITRFCGA
jgi:hypothetical protein